MGKERAETLTQASAVLSAMACRLFDLADELDQLAGQPTVPPAADGSTYWMADVRPEAELIRLVTETPRRTG